MEDSRCDCITVGEAKKLIITFQQKLRRHKRRPGGAVHSSKPLMSQVSATASQYLGIFGSIRSAQAKMPPVKLETFVNPARRRKFTAFALRPPILQWVTISRLLSSSFTRFGKSPKGMRYPFRLQIW